MLSEKDSSLLSSISFSMSRSLSILNSVTALDLFSTGFFEIEFLLTETNLISLPLLKPNTFTLLKQISMQDASNILRAFFKL